VFFQLFPSLTRQKARCSIAPAASMTAGWMTVAAKLPRIAGARALYYTCQAANDTTLLKKKDWHAEV